MKKLSLLRTLKLDPDSGLDYITAAFLKFLKNSIHEIIKEPDNKKVEALEELIQELLSSFYEHVGGAASKEYPGVLDGKDHPNAQALKDRAAGIQSQFEDTIVKFALCYLYLHQSIGVLHEALSQVPAVKTERKIEWTQDTARIMNQYQKERDLLEVQLQGLTGCFSAFEDFQTDYAALEGGIEKLSDSKEKGKAFRSFRSPLRQGNFVRARKVVDELVGKKGGLLGTNASIQEEVRRLSDVYIQILEQHKDSIKDIEGKLLLTAKELSVSIGAKEKELETKHEFIRKYFRPFLEYNLKSIHLLKEKLLVVGSLDSLLGLYVKMIRGQYAPLRDNKDVRAYEAEIIENVNFLINTNYQEIDTIGDRNRENMEQFYDRLLSFEKSGASLGQ